MNHIIVDIDGTIADSEHRLHFIEGVNKDWDGFFEACPQDEPILRNIALVQHINEFTPDIEIIMVTGRSDIIRDKTTQWLQDYSVPYDRLFMRKHGDYRPDHEVKKELADMHGWDCDNVWFVLEDRKQVCDMWRSLGMMVYQVAEGIF